MDVPLISPRWLALAAVGVVAIACDVPLEVAGYPLGPALRALGGVAVALGLVASRPTAPPPLRGARRRVIAAAGLTAVGAALLLLCALAPRSAAMLAPLAAGAVALACFFGGTGLGRVAEYQAWSFASRAWDRAVLGSTAVCLLLFLAAFAILLVHLVIGEADPPSHPTLVVAAALGRALVAGSLVSALAWTARDQADLAGQARGALARLAPWAGRLAFAAALLPPLALEAARTLHHLRSPGWDALVAGPPSRWRFPGPPGAVLERWESLRWSHGDPLALREAEASPEARTRRLRLRLLLEHGATPLLRLDQALLATFDREGALRGARFDVTEVFGSRGLRAVAHTWLDLDAPPGPDGKPQLPFVINVALVRGHGFEVEGSRMRGLLEGLPSLQPLPELTAVPQRPACTVRGYEVLFAPPAPTEAEPRFVLRCEGSLRLEGDEWPTLRFEASREDRSYRLRATLDDEARGATPRAREVIRARSYRWRGQVW
ncbi:MAG: hypothetical protein AB7N76_36695 [Planctomycetota bacterium]